MSVMDIATLSPEEIEARLQKGADDKERRLQRARQRIKQENAIPPQAPVLVFDGDDNWTDAAWCIQDIMPAEGAGMLFGESNVGKTFLALNLAMPVSANTTWQGHAVTYGTVVFFETEGGPSFAKRKHAAKVEAGLSDARVSDVPFPFVTIYEPLGFGPDTDIAVAQARAIAIREAIAERGLPPVRLTIVDTFAQNMRGDADSNHDTSAFLRAFRAFLKALSTESVFGLLIHHPGHTNKDRARGAYALPADLDLIMHLEGEQDLLTLKCVRMRDAEPFEPILLKRESRVVRMDGHEMADSYGRPVTSLVIVGRTVTITTRPPISEVASRIVKHLELHPGQTTSQINVDLHVRKDTVVEEVDKLVKRGHLRLVPVKLGKTTKQTYEPVPDTLL